MGKGAGELTRKQELFCQEYIVDYNGTKAAIRAGYEERSARQMASRMLAKDNIRSRVRELQADQVQRMTVTQDYVIQQLVETYKKCCEPTPVMEWDANEREYVEKGTYEFDSKGANKALELLGKHRNKGYACTNRNQSHILLRPFSFHKPSRYQLFNDTGTGSRCTQTFAFCIIRHFLCSCPFHSRQ